MAKKRVWRHSNDFRRMAVERFNNCENIVALAKELGIQRRLLYKWREDWRTVVRCRRRLDTKTRARDSNKCCLNVSRITTQVRFRPDRVLRDARGRRDGISERHADSVLRPQNDHRTSFDRLARSQLKIVLSEQIAQNHEDLQHRVISTDTAARSAPEGKKGKGRAQLLVRFGKTLGIEILRFLPVARRMVRTVHIHNDR